MTCMESLATRVAWTPTLHACLDEDRSRLLHCPFGGLLFKCLAFAVLLAYLMAKEVTTNAYYTLA